MEDNIYSSKILFVGMPATGKTSFLAALRHYVDADVAPKIWRQYKYSSDTEYLNRIHAKWLACEQQARTVQEQKSNGPIEIFLEHIPNSEKITLNVPDIEGEIFTQQWESRFWNERYNNLVDSASGLLLFIHPDKVIKPTFLTDNGINCLIGDFIPHEELGEAKDWDISLTPTQIIIVELLQFHLERMQQRPLAVSIVISAWDVVKNQDSDITPSKWIEESLPQLYQFLLSNFEIIKSSIFGISAQGGDFNSNDTLEKLRNFDEPADRITIQQENLYHHDISAPIQWILDTWRVN